MFNDAAPMGKECRYGRRERERRFLFGAPPDALVERTVHIFDRYVSNTRIRLRRANEVGSDGAGISVTYKLTQKLPAADGTPALITTMYLTATEYDVMAKLPAATLRKTRLSIPPLGVDVFEGELAGLVMGEAEFDDDEAMAAFVLPRYALAEITCDERFSGGRLVTTTAPELTALLAEHGLQQTAR